MPNWCLNELTITGEKKDIKAFLKFVKGKQGRNKVQPLDFEKICPTPKELFNEKLDKKMLEKKYGFSDWFGYRITNWGTKFNAGNVDLMKISDNKVGMVFNTAWTPPKMVLNKVSKMFPSIELKLIYEEVGNELAGTILFKNGIRRKKKNAKKN